MPDFVHLHCHTEYSFLLSTIHIRDLCERTSAYGMRSCAITDHGNLFGAPSFYFACKDYGLNPIIGCELFVCADHRNKSQETGRQNNHLLLLARNNTGYQNLVRLVNHGFLDGFFGIPRVDKSQLRRYAEGLICLSACLSGEIPNAILANDMDKARALASEYASIYGGDFYLELQANGLPEQERVNTGLMELAETLNLPLVATNNCHYLDAGDADAYEVLLCIKAGRTLNTLRRMGVETRDLHYKTPEAMESAFSHVPEALFNTARVAESCQVELDHGRGCFPINPLHAGLSVEDEFRRLAEGGLEKRLEAGPDRKNIDIEHYRQRLQHEMSVLIEMGLAGHFLVLHEVINWARNNAIPVGPGYGSLPSSLVAWALTITNIDPLRHNLLFECFFNAAGRTHPEIQMEFGEKGSRKMRRHMVETYGYERVAQTPAFNTLRGEELVRNVVHALGMPPETIDRINERMPSLPGPIKKPIASALQFEPDYDKDPRIGRLLEMARRLEGLVRDTSTSATGLVVWDRPLEEDLPLSHGRRGELVTQFDGPTLAKVGVVKFDFIGTKTLTLIKDTLDNISRQGIVVPDLDNLPLDDSSVYEVYDCGDTDGIFQMEATGIRKYLRMLWPTRFEDIVAMCALYRPGPLHTGMMDEFIARKHGKAPEVLPHESLREFLHDTYGVLIYQEQFMRIVQSIAGYTLEEADLLCQTMRRRRPDAMTRAFETFTAGVVENGIASEDARKIFDFLKRFAYVGFPKAHAAAHALISYYTAYLKTHHKIEFMSALLTSAMGNQGNLHKYISTCRDMGIEVTPPSVNESEREFSVRDGRILFGLGGIKGMSARGAIRDIVETRDEGGFYSSLFDLVCRVDLRRVTKFVLESLIKCGACDCFGAPRAAMLASLDRVIQRAQEKSDVAPPSSKAFREDANPVREKAHTAGIGFDCPEAAHMEMDDVQKLKAEKEALGFYFTSHPLEPFRSKIYWQGFTTLKSLSTCAGGSVVNCAVLVSSIREVSDEYGKQNAYVVFEDFTDFVEVPFSPLEYAKARGLLVSGLPLCLSGKFGDIEALNHEDSQREENSELPSAKYKLISPQVFLLEETLAEVKLTMQKTQVSNDTYMGN